MAELRKTIVTPDNIIINADCIERMIYHEETNVISLEMASGKHYAFAAEGEILELWKTWRGEAITGKYPLKD